MIRTTFTSLWARKRRLAGTSLSIVLGVAFLFATLTLGTTMEASFSSVFRQLNSGSDVIVRNADTIGTEDAEVRGTLDASVVVEVASVPGVAAAVGHTAAAAQIVGADGNPIGGQGPPTLAESWIDDPDLRAFDIVEGRGPEVPGEVVIDRWSAATGDLAVGDDATVRAPQPVPVTIVGLVGFGDQSSMNGATFVAFTPGQATELLGTAGQVDEVRVRADDTTDADTLRATIAAALPSDAEALTAAQLTTEQEQAIDADFLGFLRQLLLAFAGVALVVATFSIHNTFTILVAQRSRETALLRAIGASRRDVLLSVTIEALVVGAVAGVVGLVAGLGLAVGLKAVLGSFGLELAGSGVIVGTSTIAVSFLVGLVVTVVASTMPAVRASRVAPIEALRDAAAESPDLSRTRTLVGAAAAAVAVGITTWAPRVDDALGAVGIGAALVIVGTVLLGPALARPAARVIGAPIAALRGQPGRLAQLNARRNPRRTAASALALVVGTAVVAMFATFGSSLRTSIDQTVEQSFGGDLVITQDSFSGSSISPEVGPAVAGLDEVADLVTLSDAVVRHEGSDRYPTVADPAALDRIVDLGVEEGSIAELAPGQLAVGRSFADDEALQLGSQVVFEFLGGGRSTLRVGAIYDVEALLGPLVMTPQDWAPFDTATGDVAVLIDLADGVSLEEGRTAVETATDRYAAPPVMDRDQYIESVAGEVDQMLILVYGLLGLAVVIALLGIANTLALSIHERSKELGLLRAIGLTRGRLRATVRWESVITAVVGTVSGVVVGTFLGWGVVRAVATVDDLIVFAAPTTTLFVVVVLAAVAGVAAADRPARRAARTDVLDAIGAP